MITFQHARNKENVSFELFIIEINIWVITVIINLDKYLKDTLLLLCCSLLYLTAHFKMWNNEDRTSLFQISNHTPIQQLLSNSVAGGGLVFYVYNSINFKILKNLNKSKPNIEKVTKSWISLCIYRLCRCKCSE